MYTLESTAIILQSKEKKESASLLQNLGLAERLFLEISKQSPFLDISALVSRSSLSSRGALFAWAEASSARSWWKRSCAPTPSVGVQHRCSRDIQYVLFMFYLMWRGVAAIKKTAYHNDHCVQKKRNREDQRDEHAPGVKVLEIREGPAKNKVTWMMPIIHTRHHTYESNTWK